MLPEPSSIVTLPCTPRTLMLPEPSIIDTSPLTCETSMDPEPSSILTCATLLTSIEPEPSSIEISAIRSTTSIEPEPSSIMTAMPCGTLTSISMRPSSLPKFKKPCSNHALRWATVPFCSSDNVIFRSIIFIASSTLVSEISITALTEIALAPAIPLISILPAPASIESTSMSSVSSSR